MNPRTIGGWAGWPAPGVLASSEARQTSDQTMQSMIRIISKHTTVI